MAALKSFGNALRHGWQEAWEGWRELRQRAGSALTRFVPRKNGQHAAEAVPPLRWGLLAGDVIDRGNSVVVELELPGIRREDCRVTVQDGYLRVSGERGWDRECAGASYYLMERTYGGFERTLKLPPGVDPDSAHAQLRDGVLTVKLGKRKGAESRRHSIAVK